MYVSEKKALIYAVEMPVYQCIYNQYDYKIYHYLYIYLFLRKHTEFFSGNCGRLLKMANRLRRIDVDSTTVTQ